MLVLGMLLQRFEFVDYLNYELKVKEGLTIKPDGLFIKIKQRPGRTTGTTPIAITTVPTNGQAAEPKARPQRTGEGHNTPLMVLFGSNLGTAEGIATRIAQDGSDRGYAVTLGALDDHTGELPHEGALVVVCASYNGQPPDNAERFCRWITDSATPSDAGSGLAFSVFGCGNMDWASTYQAVPTLIDAQLEAHGARRVHARGEGDARSDFDGQFSEWYSGPVVFAGREPGPFHRVHHGDRDRAAAAPHHGEQADDEPRGDVLPGSSVHPGGQPGAAPERSVRSRLAVGPPYRAGVAGRNGVPDR